MKAKKKMIAIVIMLIIICTFATTSYGLQLKELNGTPTQVETLKNAGNSIVKVVLTIGIVVSVIMLILLGIKYMMGSVEEKAEYKKTLIPYIIGAGLVFAASGIAQIIYDIAIKI